MMNKNRGTNSNSSIILTGNRSNIIKTGHKNNVQFFNNILIGSSINSTILPFTCPNGTEPFIGPDGQLTCGGGNGIDIRKILFNSGGQILFMAIENVPDPVISHFVGLNGNAVGIISDGNTPEDDVIDTLQFPNVELLSQIIPLSGIISPFTIIDINVKQFNSTGLVKVGYVIAIFIANSNSTIYKAVAFAQDNNDFFITGSGIYNLPIQFSSIDINLQNINITQDQKILILFDLYSAENITASVNFSLELIPN